MTGKSPQTVLRFTLSERLQHLLLLSSLIVLALTGLSLMFYDTALGRLMIKLEGGYQGRGTIHRIAALVLIAVGIYHHAYILFFQRGNTLLRNYLFKAGDLKRAMQNLRFSMGRVATPPYWGKFSLAQKLQYFGVVVGVVSMIVTGLVLWIGPAAIALIPKWLMDLTVIVHGYEGLLIFLILFLWHLYNVHLAPGNFPMNMSWITGRIAVDECRTRYPGEYERLIESGELEK